MYTEEDTKKIIHGYVGATDKTEAVRELAIIFGKSKKSIIGKLSREGVYEKQPYLSKTGQPPITKKEIVHMISLVLHCELDSIAGLDKAPKLDLKNLLDQLSG